MNKLYIASLLSVCLSAIACSNESHDSPLVIDGETATLYIGEYMEITPADNIIEEQVPSDERITLLSDAVPTQKMNHIQSETQEIKDNHFSIAINLLFASRTALLDIDSLCYKHEVYNTYNVTEYEYTPGVYTINSRINSNYSIKYNVTSESIHATYIYNETNKTVSSPMLIYELTDGARQAKEVVETRNSESKAYTAKYSGKLKVTCTDIAIMQNDDFTFAFDPATGKLQELQPENKEIGDLKRAM